MKSKTGKVSKALDLMSVVFLFMVAFMVVMFFFVVDAKNEMNVLKADVTKLHGDVASYIEVSNDIMLYKTIEDIWFKKGRTYMDDSILRELSLMTYTYHKKYGSKGAIPIGLDYWRIFAWVDYESKFNPQAESYAGAVGLTQIMLITGIDWLDRFFDLKGLSKKQVLGYLHDPLWNFQLGLEGLKYYQLGFMSAGVASKDDWKLTFSMYNWSIQAVSNLMQSVEKGTPKASLHYAITIEKLILKYKKV